MTAEPVPASIPADPGVRLITVSASYGAGAIGYVELAYVKQNRLSAAALQNASGQFVEPSAASATATRLRW